MSDLDRLRDLDALSTAALLDAGELSSAEVIDAAVRRTAAVNAAVGGVAAPLFATARARVADSRPHGRLGGVPTVVKEIVGMTGVPFTNGSRAWHGHRSRRTWAAARQHLATGLVPVATTTMSEFGLTPTTEPLGRPPTRNPWALDHTPGGSSGGSAALVAGGAVPVAFGTDGAGSIRVPASCCGVVGLKPSQGRLTGLDDMERTPLPIAVHGVLARSVRDVAAYHAAAEQAVPSPAGLRPIGLVAGPGERRLRIGVQTAASTGALVDVEVVRAVEDAAGVLDDAGHRVTPVDPAAPGSLADDVLAYFGMLAFAIGVLGRRELGRGYDTSLHDPWTRHLAERGRIALVRLPAVLARIRAAVDRHRAQFAAVDVVLSPVTTTPAPPLGHLGPTVAPGLLRERIGEWLAFTPIQNVAGTPAISVPSTRSSAGLPIGVQLAGLVGDEAVLLGLAYELEAAAPWPRIAPIPS